MKYYVVKEGREPGIFKTWEECQERVKGFSDAKFKAFTTIEEAEAYLSGKEYWQLALEEEIASGYAIAYTDGSYDKRVRKYSFACVCIDLSNNEHDISGSGNSEKFLPAKNVAGEVLGALAAFEWAAINKHKKLKIYHDYEGIAKWITGEWQAKSPISIMYKQQAEKWIPNFSEVLFEKVKGHSNNPYNDKADLLCKQCLYG